ncbi:MAG: ATP-binding protein, partial [Desulfococcaceae bacterium]
MNFRPPDFPFPAIVGQERMKLALILNVVNPTLSGVLIRGEKGTGKSTAVRSLAAVLPEISVIEGLPFNLPPDVDSETLAACRAAVEDVEGDVRVIRRRVPVVELPVGATEDRVVGSLDLEHALKKGTRRVEPGLLAAAHRGILYVDEVNLLDDHVVDVLLDAAAMGVNAVEREGVSFSHPARFTLVGTMNPEEGELRPQLLDRFGLCVEVSGVTSADERVAIMERRTAFEEDPVGFAREWEPAAEELAEKIIAARERLPGVTADREILLEIAHFCLDVGVDGHRGDIVLLKTARTLAAWRGRDRVEKPHIEEAAELALPHRVRRQPLEEIAGEVGNRRRDRR